MRKLRKRNVAEENQRVPELLVHNTFEGEAVGKLSFVTVRNSSEKISPPEHIYDSPPTLRKTRKLMQDEEPIFSRSEQMFDDLLHEMNEISTIHENPEERSRKWPLDISMIPPLEGDAVVKSRKKKTSSPKYNSDLVFEQLLHSFEDDRRRRSAEIKRKKRKSVKRIPHVRVKKLTSVYTDSDSTQESAASHQKRQKQVYSEKHSKALTSKSSRKVEKKVHSSTINKPHYVPGIARLPGNFKILQNLMISPARSKKSTMSTSKRLSIIEEAPSPELMNPEFAKSLDQRCADKDKENLDPMRLFFLKDLQIMKINLEYMGQLAKVLDFEEELKGVLRNALMRGET